MRRHFRSHGQGGAWNSGSLPKGLGHSGLTAFAFKAEGAVVRRGTHWGMTASMEGTASSVSVPGSHALPFVPRLCV